MSYGNYPDKEKIKKILVIKLRHLGDTLLSTPIFSILKEKYPHAQIDAYIFKDSKQILELNDNISNIYVYDRSWKIFFWIKRLFKEVIFLKKLRKQKYDLVLNLSDGDRAWIATKTCKAKYRVGFDCHNRKKNKLFTHIVKHPANPRHTVERNLDALRCIGIFPKESEKKLFFKISTTAQKTVKKILVEKNFANFILIHPLSRWKFKCWPMEKVEELVGLLIQEGNKVILTSGPDEEEKIWIEKIVKRFPKERVLNLSGGGTIHELAALIELCEVFLCVDSLPLHISSVLRTKVVTIFGPTSDLYWGPWLNPNAKVLFQNFSCRPCLQDGCGGSKYSECLQTLKVEIVLKEIKILLKSLKKDRDFPLFPCLSLEY